MLLMEVIMEKFYKKLYLKRYSSAIPNPHSIPSAYKSLLHDQRKYIECILTLQITSLGNWNIAN